MDDVRARRADDAGAAYKARVRALEDREVELKRVLRDLDEAHAVVRESIHTLSSMAGEAFPARSALFEGMQAELSVLADRAIRELDDGADRTRDELRETCRRMDDERERYFEALRDLDEEAGSR